MQEIAFVFGFFGTIASLYVSFRFGVFVERRSWLRAVLEADRVYVDKNQKWARIASVANRIAAELGYEKE
jgi:hypothetical protein